MPVFREAERFPTRNYPYGREREGVGLASASHEPIGVLEASRLYRHIVGIDRAPHLMTSQELSVLGDPFGLYLRSVETFPLTLVELLSALDNPASSEHGLAEQLVFLAADGGHIPWTPETDTLRRAFRFAIARGDADFPILISSSTAVRSNDDAAFLQVIGWDSSSKIFHFYERRGGTFLWAGSSNHALENPTRGKGPFDSHVNGSLVMKELRSPWLHWHAPQAGINPDALSNDDPLRDEPLFQQRVTAERLEQLVVRPGIRRWNAARVEKVGQAQDHWTTVSTFVRQVLFDTTVNLATSESASALIGEGRDVRPPLSFFVNRDTLFETLELAPDDPDLAAIIIPGSFYRECLTRYDVHRDDGAIRVDGDVHFAFLTPEPAYEDTQLAEEMLASRLISRRFLAALAMTDFTNPVFSPRRAALLKHVPKELTGGNWAAQLEEAMLRSAVADAVMGSPEAEFVANFELAGSDAPLIARITGYLEALKRGMRSAQTVDGWFRLAEWRRRQFRKRKLSEFALTTPRTNIPLDAPALRMTEHGSVETITLNAEVGGIDGTA